MGDCIQWQGSVDRSNGYGYLSLGYHKKLYAHRAAYMEANGEIPKGFVIDHICRNRTCVNPAHLRAVTKATNSNENSVGVTAQNLAKTHCPKRHEYTPENTYITPSGHRRCRTCRKVEQKSRTRGFTHGGDRRGKIIMERGE